MYVKKEKTEFFIKELRKRFAMLINTLEGSDISYLKLHKEFPECSLPALQEIIRLCVQIDYENFDLALSDIKTILRKLEDLP